jgi:serine/threonine-protein kinase
MLVKGDTFERYVIEAPLGEGGMGAVYRAHDPKLGRRVALKVISAAPGPEADARLVREARAAAAIDHPNAVAIFDVGEHEGVPFIVMELVEGKTLRASTGDAAPPMPIRIRQLGDVARALSGAHKKGVVHRDIKPENVMVRDDGMVKVLDFGIARRSASVDPVGPTQTPALPTLTIDGVKLGTPVYMAPEQIRGDALDGRADQFAWGVVAYELCAGRLPWRGAGDPLAVMASVLTDPVDGAPLDAASVPEALQQVILRALSKRPEDRFASMDDLLRALEGGVASDPAPSPKRASASAPPAGATAAQQFSTAEVREVLGKALESQAERSTKLGFEDLLAVAAEVGVDPESLREASRALRARSSAPQEPTPSAAITASRTEEGQAWVRRQRRDFFRHAGVYAIVNAALLFLGLVILGPWTPWWVWFIPVLAWGVGLAIHGLVALTAHEDDWKEEQQSLTRWREQRQRRHEERMALLTGRRPLHPPDRREQERLERERERERQREQRRERKDAAKAQRRVEAAPDPDRERLRVAPQAEPMDTGRELAAEEEAAAAVERGERRQRR